ncbi:aminotransferase DegT [Candidatus Woesearchaeota archaeon]|nr:aminotransferase DegT [Candidatus Woesearchaeota archaeon]|tara:strand:+ start:184 stop:1278 length:1095 start_codon:yes stop_codon:yes gene_type:complete
MKSLPVAEPDLRGNESKYVMECLESTWISSLGKYISAFEEKFSSYCSVKYGVSTYNGTVALQLALAALNIKEGDEVIVPALTFIATANAVTYLGAKPVFVDADRKTWNMDVNKIKEKITDKTKAIIPVHLYGHPCDMDPILELAQQYNLYVIEDVAEAHGAEYKGKKLGSLGTIGCFSFYGNKIITTGEGGMCVTNDEKLAERMRFLKDHGMTEQYYHPEIGFNFRMTNLQAAIGVAQLERINELIATKIKHAKLYKELLSSVKGITFQPEESYAKSVFWLHSILIEDDFRCNRDALMKELKDAGIDSRPFFIPMNELPPYRQEGFPVASELSRKGMNLPSSTLLTDEDIKRVCSVIAGNPKTL